MSYEKLREAFRTGIDKKAKSQFTTVAAKVTMVDLQEFYVDVEPVGEMAEVLDVRLRAALEASDLGMIMVPKVGSTVLISAINNDWNSAFVSLATELDKILVKVGNSTAEITADEIKLNGGSLGGLVKAKELKAQLDKTNAVVSALMQTLLTWVPVPSDGGAALKTAMQTALTGKTVGSFTNIENSKITHG